LGNQSREHIRDGDRAVRPHYYKRLALNRTPTPALNCSRARLYKYPESPKIDKEVFTFNLNQITTIFGSGSMPGGRSLSDEEVEILEICRP
jgi:hypothetical protein